MKIFNITIVISSFFMIFLGLFNGTIAFEEEVEILLTYETDYSMYISFLPLFFALLIRYFKYILLIQFYSIGYLGRVCVPIISMYKAYMYGFICSLIFVTFDGIMLYKRIGSVIIQMTLSLIITVLFSCVAMNFLQNKYSSNNKHKILFFAFVFSLICCIIISLIDYVLIILLYN